MLYRYGLKEAQHFRFCRAAKQYQGIFLAMDAETDVIVLLESIKCHLSNNPAAVKEALITLAKMCTRNGRSIFIYSILSLDLYVSSTELFCWVND